MEHINYFAVLAAATSAFVIGGLWYSPLMFHRTWAAVNGLTGADLEGGAARIFAVSFALELIMAFNLAAFLGAPDTTVAWGATAGALAGLGWVAPAIGVVALFERRSITYVAINGGYAAVSLAVMGAILGAWR